MYNIGFDDYEKLVVTKTPTTDYERQQIIEHLAHLKEVNREVAAQASFVAAEAEACSARMASLAIRLRHAANRLIEKDMV